MEWVTPVTVTHALLAVTVDEASEVTNTGTFNDPGGRETMTLSASVGTITRDDAAGTWSWSHTPADDTNAPSTVTITATNVDGDSASTTFSLTVNNLLPTITNFSYPTMVQVNTVVVLRAGGTDPSPNDTLGYQWYITNPSGDLSLQLGDSHNLVFSFARHLHHRPRRYG